MYERIEQNSLQKQHMYRVWGEEHSQFDSNTFHTNVVDLAYEKHNRKEHVHNTLPFHVKK